jgi:hypothetical protein
MSADEADDQAMPSDEDVRALHREITVKCLMVDALKKASPNTPMLGLPLSERGAATVAALLRRSADPRAQRLGRSFLP